jgi:hypothetical protein
LNAEITDSSIVHLDKGFADGKLPESCTSKFKIGPRISNLIPEQDCDPQTEAWG